MKYKLGHSFATPVLFVSIVFSLFAVFISYNEPIFGIIILLISSFFWSASYGIEINIRAKKYREYSSAFGLKWGNWLSLDKLPFVSIMTVREGMTVFSRTNQSTTLVENKFGIYLLSNSHREKVLIRKFNDDKDAKEFLKDAATKLSKEVVQYNPVISAKTRKRR